MNSPRILALLPFLVKGALSIAIFRALRARGVDIRLPIAAMHRQLTNLMRWRTSLRPGIFSICPA